MLQKPSTLQVWKGTGTLASPPLMPKHKTVVYFPFPHQWCSIVSERPSSKNCITQGPVHRFVSIISLLVPAWVPTGSHEWVKKGARVQVFPGELCKISKDTFFKEHVLTTASGLCDSWSLLDFCHLFPNSTFLIMKPCSKSTAKNKVTFGGSFRGEVARGFRK